MKCSVLTSQITPEILYLSTYFPFLSASLSCNSFWNVILTLACFSSVQLIFLYMKIEVARRKKLRGSALMWWFTWTDKRNHDWTWTVSPLTDIQMQIQPWSAFSLRTSLPPALTQYNFYVWLSLTPPPNTHTGPLFSFRLLRHEMRSDWSQWPESEHHCDKVTFLCFSLFTRENMLFYLIVV